MNKCTINERYIPEHQNKLNIYDLQNYEFLPIFFQLKQVAQLSQRDRAAGWVSYGQKWKTGTGRQYLRTI